MKILVTGAAGRIGQATCGHLHAHGCEISATDARYLREDRFPFRLADLSDRSACYDVVEGQNCIVHLGNIPNSGQGHLPQALFAENATINMNLFQAAAEVGVSKIIFASTIQVIDKARAQANSTGQPPVFPLDGEAGPCPTNSYALSKLCGEIQLDYFSRQFGISGICLRLPYIAPREPSRMVWPIPGEMPERLRELPVILAIEDATDLIRRIIEADLPGFRVYFPAASFLPLPASPAEVVSRYFPNATLTRPPETLTSLVDISRITTETGWKPRVDTADDFRQRSESA